MIWYLKPPRSSTYLAKWNHIFHLDFPWTSREFPLQQSTTILGKIGGVWGRDLIWPDLHVGGCNLSCPFIFGHL